MSGMTKKVLVVFLPLLLSGCITYSLEELRHTKPKGTPFQQALAKLYLDFASQEEKDYDWFSSMHFADKGLMAAYGKDVGPEELKNWKIPKNVLPEMTKARAGLVAALTPDNIDVRPQLSAEAQFYFDCWAEQQNENWQVEDIRRCRDGLKKALDQLQTHGKDKKKPVAKPAKPVKETKPVKEAKKEAKPAKEKPKEVKKLQPEAKTPSSPTVSYIVFFESGQPTLTSYGKKVLDEIVKSLAHAESYEVVINRRTDKSDDAKQPGQLSEARAQAVKQWLVKSGIRQSAIQFDGEAANAKKPAGRKVEIFLSK